MIEQTQKDESIIETNWKLNWKGQIKSKCLPIYNKTTLIESTYDTEDMCYLIIPGTINWA